MKKIMLSIVAIALMACLIGSASACETRTPGYWKNHPDAWPTSPGTSVTTTMNVYGFVQTFNINSNAMTILGTPVKGDARINLQQKVIAASLSILSDPNIGWNNDPRYSPEALALGGLPGMVNTANNLINANPGPWTPGSAADISGVRAQALTLAGQIDYWLNFFDID